MAFSLKGEEVLLTLLRCARKKRRQAKSLASLRSFCGALPLKFLTSRTLKGGGDSVRVKI